MGKKPKRVIAEVEDFIKRFHDGDSIVAPEAKHFIIATPKKR